MNCILKVRDRTTNKVKEAQIDADDFERLKGYSYLVDKNSKEPFREASVGGKRPRIALKRDVMGFELGDPRRVCYVNKQNVMDCRKVNLKTKDEENKVVKMVKTVKVPEKATVEAVDFTATPVAPTATNTTVEAPAAPVVAQTINVSTLPTSSDLDVKLALLTQIDLKRLAAALPMDTILAVWAETNGYRKQA